MNRQQVGLWVVLAGAVLAAGVVQPVGAAQEYRFVDLGAGGAGFTSAVAWGGTGGRQFGFATGSGEHAMMWSATADSAVDLHPSGFTHSWILGAGDGQQVGHGRVFGGPYPYYKDHALVWSGTAQSAVDLNPAGFEYSEARGVDGGRQVGSGTLVGGVGHALLWSGRADSFVDLHPSGFSSSAAYAISGDEIVGAGGGSHALLWQGTSHTVVDLHPAWASSSVGWGVSSDEQVGSASVGSTEHAVLWRGSAESAVDLNPAGFLGSMAVTVRGGMQAGFGWHQGGTDHALLWSGSADRFVDLQQFVPGNFDSSRAFGIDEYGNILGSVGSGSVSHAGVWVPIPEPATLVLLVAGAAGLPSLRRRTQRSLS